LHNKGRGFVQMFFLAKAQGRSRISRAGAMQKVRIKGELEASGEVAM
jgi:hypothetical protein